MNDFTIHKCDHTGKIQLSYTGKVIKRGDNWVCIESYFTRDQVDIGEFVFCAGDRMLEWFYADRYYNVFRVHDGHTDTVKGWYCNITRPAHITESSTSADDLALDVIVTPDGTVTLRDEDEFEALTLSQEEAGFVWNAVEEIRALVDASSGPFAIL